MFRPSLPAAALLGCCLLLTPSVGYAQTESGSGYVTEDSMKDAQAAIANLSSDLSEKIKITQAALKNVVDMDDIGERERVLKDQFNAIDQSVRSILDQVSDNSFFMDSLMDARARTLRLKRSFEQRPAEYPNRDALIGRLDKALLHYQQEQLNLGSMEEQATIALINLGQARTIMIDELKVGAVESSVANLQKLTKGLGELVSKLDEVASAQLVTSSQASSLGQN